MDTLLVYLRLLCVLFCLTGTKDQAVAPQVSKSNCSLLMGPQRKSQMSQEVCSSQIFLFGFLYVQSSLDKLTQKTVAPLGVTTHGFPHQTSQSPIDPKECSSKRTFLFGFIVQRSLGDLSHTPNGCPPSHLGDLISGKFYLANSCSKIMTTDGPKYFQWFLKIPKFVFPFN